MHESSLAKDIVNRVLRETKGRERVTSLSIVIGEDEHIAAQALSLAVARGSANTAAEGAAVHIRSVPGRGVTLETIEIREGA